MKANLIIGLYLLVALIAYFQKGACNNPASELLPENADENENPVGSASTDTIFLFEDTSSIILDTIQFELFTGGKAKHKLVLTNKSEKDLPLDISVEYGLQNNYALEFNGIDSYFICENDSSLNITNKMTIEAWIYAFYWKNMTRILRKGITNNDYVLRVTNKNEFLFRIYNNINNKVSFPAPSLNTWHHIAAVFNYESRYMKLYCNGKLVAETNEVSIDIPVNNYELYIGANRKPYFGQMSPHLIGSGFFNGFLDEIRLWKTVRSKKQIQDNMFTEILDPEPDLAAYWKFNENSGDQSFDASINNNTGKLSQSVKHIKSSAPIKIEWLNVNNVNMILQTGSTYEIPVGIDVTGLDRGIYNANIVISENKAIIPIQINNEAAPDISILEDTVYFNNCALGDSAIQSLTICNSGFEPLNIYNIISEHPYYHVNKSKLKLNPCECEKIEITFSPGLFKKASGYVKIISSDIDQPEISIPVQPGKVFIPGYILNRIILIENCNFFNFSLIYFIL